MEKWLFDPATATALSQIMPVLLLALILEMRRTEMHLRGRSIRKTRIILALFFGAFAVIETVLVLLIDGRLFPARWSDLVAALVIFALLWLLFVLSMMSERGTQRSGRPDDQQDDD
jgi:cytochrome bd-type quinol oxidase subunit 2